MRRGLVLTSIAVLILFFLVGTFMTSRYVNSGAGLFQIATLFNFLGRPIVAIILAIVLAGRFKDIWSRRVDISERADSVLARFAQTCGVSLMMFFYLALALLLTLRFSVPSSSRAELPVFFILSPLLMALPFGYFLFEMGRLIDKDRNAQEI